MTGGQRKKIEELLALLREDEKEIYREIAGYAVELGYLPSITKNAHDVVIDFAFSKAKIGRRLMKIGKPQGAAWNSGKAKLNMTFYAAEYSDFFQERVRRDFETVMGGKSCDGKCKDCHGKYTYVYPDGKRVFRCSLHSLIEISPIGAEHVAEIKKMMKMQDDFWMDTIKSAD